MEIDTNLLSKHILFKRIKHVQVDEKLHKQHVTLNQQTESISNITNRNVNFINNIFSDK